MRKFTMAIAAAVAVVLGVGLGPVAIAANAGDASHVVVAGKKGEKLKDTSGNYYAFFKGRVNKHPKVGKKITIVSGNYMTFRKKWLVGGKVVSTAAGYKPKKKDKGKKLVYSVRTPGPTTLMTVKWKLGTIK